ncbi:MAG: cytochrome C peroxidase [Spirirestis rafaelensis WJT71-NPBG6]|jgi:cytochrome c peroxidase|nr:cytochrome C peroxidase [Spirirestis rafaelensis WJT71-NPBG6]
MAILLNLILVLLFASFLLYLLLASGRGFKFVNLTRLVSKNSKAITIAVIVIAAVISGHTVSAQITPPPSLKTVKVPEPNNLSDFIKDKTAAIKLGKSLFWDMQVGSDGLLSCASCHFHAGADNRSKNQINPGLLVTPNPDATFQLGGAPNYQLKPEDYPFHKLLDPNKADSTVLSSINDVASSQGAFNAEFVDVTPGKAEDNVNFKPDPVFNVGGVNVRRVEPRNTPTVINAVYNFRNFWDGRAQDIFNGVNPFGLRDPNAFVGKADNPAKLNLVKISLNNSSLASQAVGPPLSSFEQSADGRTFEEIGDKFGDIDKKSKSASKGKKPLRKTGKKLLPLRPLGKQLVHPDDSVLGSDSRVSQPGLKTATYEKLIEDAFKSEWWKSNRMIQIDEKGQRNIVKKPDKSLATNEYTLMEYNFPLFFGLSVQMYEATLVSDNTPFDQFQEQKPNTSALTAQQQQGLNLFLNNGCIFCHAGAEFTAASVSNVQKNGRLTRSPAPGNPIEDTGFFKIGVTPELEDLGVGADDQLQPVSRPLSEARLAQQGSFQQVFGEAPNITFGPNDKAEADAVFKAPGLRNVELTAPYMHNGGMLTLRQVVDFYSRGAGDDENKPRLRVLNLSEENKEALVAFMKSLTDERVRQDKAPFDHPQLFVPNGHPGDTSSVTNDGTGKATEKLLEIPAVGRNGGSGTPNFLSSTN